MKLQPKKIVISSSLSILIFLLFLWLGQASDVWRGRESSPIIRKQIIETVTPDLGKEVASSSASVVSSSNGEAYFILGNDIWVNKKGEQKQVTFDGKDRGRRSYLQISPKGKYLAFFQDLSDEATMSKEDYFWHNYVSINLLDVNHQKIEEVYRGSFRVGDFEWISNNELSVWVGCGSECSYLEVVDVFSKNKTPLQYGVGYAWSPNKRYVLAYHYSVQAGITVGDKNGNNLFTLKRNYPAGSRWFSDHEAVWSIDSSKLALIIHKDKSPNLELLVFDVKNKFKILLSRDLESQEFLEVGWKDVNSVYYKTDTGVKLVKLI